MIPSFLDEFGAGKKKQVIPAEPNTVFKRQEHGKMLANMDQSKCRSGIGKMIHMMRWSRLDKYNMTHYCARLMMLAGRTYYDAMVCIMDYYMTTPERGLVLKLHGD